MMIDMWSGAHSACNILLDIMRTCGLILFSGYMLRLYLEILLIFFYSVQDRICYIKKKIVYSFLRGGSDDVLTSRY